MFKVKLRFLSPLCTAASIQKAAGQAREIYSFYFFEFYLAAEAAERNIFADKNPRHIIKNPSAERQKPKV